MSVKQDWEDGQAIGYGIIYIVGAILGIGCLVGGFIAFKNFTLARKITFIAFIVNALVTVIIAAKLSSNNKYVKHLKITAGTKVEKGFEVSTQNLAVDSYTFIPRGVLIFYAVLYLVLGLDCTLNLIFKNWRVTSFYFVPAITVLIDAYLVYRFHANKKDIQTSLELKKKYFDSLSPQAEHTEQFKEISNVVEPKYKALPLMIFKAVTAVLFIVLTILSAINL